MLIYPHPIYIIQANLMKDAQRLTEWWIQVRFCIQDIVKNKGIVYK